MTDPHTQRELEIAADLLLDAADDDEPEPST
jgi:hypothetical protein